MAAAESRYRSREAIPICRPACTWPGAVCREIVRAIPTAPGPAAHWLQIVSCCRAFLPCDVPILPREKPSSIVAVNVGFQRIVSKNAHHYL